MLRVVYPAGAQGGSASRHTDVIADARYGVRREAGRQKSVKSAVLKCEKLLVITAHLMIDGSTAMLYNRPVSWTGYGLSCSAF
jgi:hypothetical protein